MTAPLRIGIDARELLGDTTGVGRYLGELLRRWAMRADAARRRLILYTPAPLTVPLPPQTVDVRLLPGGSGTRWEQTTLRRAVRREAPDVFFAPAYTAPLGLRVPLVLTIHDVSFVARPEWFGFPEGLRRRFITRRAARAARAVITVSTFSCRELEARLHLPPGRVIVIPQGTVERRGDGGGRDAPFVLYVGSIFNRRRLPDLIAAFARAAADLPEARLIVVGSNRTWPHQDLAAVARAHGVAERVDLRAFVDERELGALYAGASVFAFISEYEGFGLTPLEALAAGVQPVVADTPVSREVYGSSATFVPIGDVGAAARALRAHLTAPEPRDVVRRRAAAVLSRYSWEASAERTLDVLERAAGRS